MKTIERPSSEINKLTTLNINDIMEIYNYSIKDISIKFNIPYRTIQNWKSDTATPPQYVINMIYDILTYEHIELCETKLLEHYDQVLDKASDLLHDGRIKEAISLIDNA